MVRKLLRISHRSYSSDNNGSLHYDNDGRTPPRYFSSQSCRCTLAILEFGINVERKRMNFLDNSYFE